MSQIDPASLIAGTDLVYVSDYFSFVGADERGHVAFAMDNNRGQDGAQFIAEHLYIVLHDERAGWIDLIGQGRYTPPSHDLLPIPDSPAFQFVGTPATGLTISSPINDLTLASEPIAERVRRDDNATIFVMGSATATLTWRGRTIPGRLIYEYLVRRGFNLMTRRSLKGLAEFQGLYLLAGDADDVYIQAIRKRHGAGAFTVVGDRLGFTVRGDTSAEMQEVDFRATKHAFAFGLYRWPTAWRVSWSESARPATLTIRLLTRKQPIGNWFIVGFAMGIAQGELMYGGQTIPVYGLAELLMVIG